MSLMLMFLFPCLDPLKLTSSVLQPLTAAHRCVDTETPPSDPHVMPKPPVAPLSPKAGPPIHLAHLNSNMGDL